MIHLSLSISSSLSSPTTLLTAQLLCLLLHILFALVLVLPFLFRLNLPGNCIIQVKVPALRYIFPGMLQCFMCGSLLPPPPLQSQAPSQSGASRLLALKSSRGKLPRVQTHRMIRGRLYISRCYLPSPDFLLLVRRQLAACQALKLEFTLGT